MTKLVIVTRSFSGQGFTFGDSPDPQEMADDVAEMAVRAGFGTYVTPPAKPKPAAKPKPKAKAKSKK